MPKTDATDGSTKQWDKLQAMRQRSGTALAPPAATPETPAGGDPEGQRAAAEAIAEEQRRLLAGEPVGGDPTPDPDDDDGDDDDETPPETVTVAAHERAKPKIKADADKDLVAPEGTEFVEIDGKKVAVAPELAAAVRESEAALAATVKTNERDELVDAVVGRVKALLPPAPDAAALAAQKALDDAAREVPVTAPMPDATLAISDPVEYNKQLQAHIAEKADRAAAKVLADRDARDQQTRQTTQAEDVKRQEAWAREQLGIQFYRQFKVLDDANVKPLVDVLLNKKFDEVIASGILSKPGTPAEREALKVAAFNAVAAAATKQIVAVRGTAAATPAPAPAPPTLATSAANRGPRAKPLEPPAKKREKFPSNSVSSMLKAHQDRKRGAPAAS